MSDYLEIFEHLDPAPFDEDCMFSLFVPPPQSSLIPVEGLNINVIAPSNAKSGDKLPVVAVS